MDENKVRSEAEAIASRAFSEYVNLLDEGTPAVDSPDCKGFDPAILMRNSFIRVVGAAVESLLIEKENIVGELRPLGEAPTIGIVGASEKGPMDALDDDDRADAIVDDPADVYPEEPEEYEAAK